MLRIRRNHACICCKKNSSPWLRDNEISPPLTSQREEINSKCNTQRTNKMGRMMISPSSCTKYKTTVRKSQVSFSKKFHRKWTEQSALVRPTVGVARGEDTQVQECRIGVIWRGIPPALKLFCFHPLQPNRERNSISTIRRKYKITDGILKIYSPPPLDNQSSMKRFQQVYLISAPNLFYSRQDRLKPNGQFNSGREKVRWVLAP